MSPKQSDSVEAMLRKADRTLDDWFKQSRMTTQQASVVFGRFLTRARREGAGALRHPVDGLQAGLKKLSAGLEHLEQEATPKPRTSRRSNRKAPAVTRKRTSARRRRNAA